jgi:hypothetical protein
MIRRRLPVVLRWALQLLGPVVLLVTGLLGGAGMLLLLVLCAAMAAGEHVHRFSADRLPPPSLVLALSPLLLLHYSSVSDFRIRLACFFMLAAVMVLARRRPVKPLPFSLAAARPWQAWLLSFLVLAAAATFIYSRGIHLSGDEPHYILVAQSLVEDGDVDLKNNLDQRKYARYMPVELRFHGSVRDGRYHSFHLPGVSFLLVPFYWLFDLLGGAVPGNLYFRLVAAFIHSFFALGLFLLLRRRREDGDNGGLFIFFLATFPLVFQGVHLFPELPGAALVIFAYLFARDRRRYFTAGLLLAGVPWLHLKYSLPILFLSLAIVAWIWREEPGLGGRLKRLAAFAAAPLASMSLLLLFSKVLYGSFNPTAIGAQFAEKSFFAVPLGLRVETLLSFFLDQRDGLLVYAPVFLLIFLAARKDVRSRIRDFPLLAAMFISYVLLHAFTTSRGGYSPSARPTLFVFWIMVIALAAYRRQAGDTGRSLFRFLGGLTVFATVWLFYYPYFLYQPVSREVTQRASALLLFLGSSAADLSRFFPSFLKKPNADYLPNWLWLSALALALALYYARASWPAMDRPARLLLPAAGLLLMVPVCFFPHVHLQTRHVAAGHAFYCNSRNFSPKKEAGGFRIKAGQNYDLFFDRMGSAADRLELLLVNDEGAAIKVTSGARTLLKASRAHERRLELRLSAMRSFRLGRRRLVHLGLETKPAGGLTFFLLKLR